MQCLVKTSTFRRITRYLFERARKAQFLYFRLIMTEPMRNLMPNNLFHFGGQIAP